MDISQDDKFIFSKIRKGDVSVFERLFKKHYSNLCVFAENYVKEKPLAEEIVSEVFMKLWEKRHNVVIHTSIQAYLYTSVYNNSLKQLEHMKVFRKYYDYASYMLEKRELLHPQSEHYPLANLISKEVEKEIQDAIDSLPDQCKEIFILQRFDDLSYDEIASKLNISINTVRTQLMRAMSKLRESLKDHLPKVK